MIHHRLEFGKPGDWQFHVVCLGNNCNRLNDNNSRHSKGERVTAWGWYMWLGIWSVAYFRPFTCIFLGHSPGTYSTLEAYKDMGPVCVRCNRMIK